MSIAPRRLGDARLDDETKRRALHREAIEQHEHLILAAHLRAGKDGNAREDRREDDAATTARESRDFTVATYEPS